LTGACGLASMTGTATKRHKKTKEDIFVTFVPLCGMFPDFIRTQ